MPPEELPKFYRRPRRRARRVRQRRAARLSDGGTRDAVPEPVREQVFRRGVYAGCSGRRSRTRFAARKSCFDADYEKIAANRAYFGDFDPFGDFDLLFGADKLNLKIADIPIHYRDRTYGTTNIQRWSHGWLLLRMMCFAARKLKFV